MPNSLTIEKRVEILFGGLDKRPSKTAMPGSGALATHLIAIAEKAERNSTATVTVNKEVMALFATAAVEMWQRGVHSFLISSSLSMASPIWSSVSGYYASHYCVRGLAHLLGYFQLHGRKKVVRFNIEGGKYNCYFEDKGGKNREHKFYWKAVNQDSNFHNNPFFTSNDDGPNKSESDSGHRNKANYFDHINNFPVFQPLSEAVLKDRIDFLSKIELSSIPLPRKIKYPDIDNVQLVAYHRLIIFRNFLDNILGGSNTFWKVHRSPAWCSAYINFQVVKPLFMEAYRNTV